MSELLENGETLEEELLRKHRKEKKDLQGKIQSLKKSSSKFDKKKKREVLEEIAKLELELDVKQEEELNQLKATSKEVGVVTSELEAVHINGSESDGDNKLGEIAPKNGPDFQQRVSKAQRRRDKRNNQQRERNQRIAEEEAEAARNGVRAVEGRAIGKILVNRNLVLHQIPSDGNCLYGAIDHQLSLVGKAQGVSKLRQLTAEHLRQNQDEFLPFIAPLADGGEPLNDEQYSSYCDRVEHSQEAWGGQVELQALSHVLRSPIEVLQGSGPSVLLGGEYKNTSVIDGKPHTITLTYHRHAFGLGEHYNSVQPKSEELEENEGDESLQANI